MSQLLFCLPPHSITLLASFAVPGVWQGCQTVWRAEAWVFEFPYQSKLPSWGETGLRASISNASATHMPHAWTLLEGDQCPSPQLQQPLMVRTRPLIVFSGFVIHRTKFDVCLITRSQGVRMEICPGIFHCKTLWESCSGPAETAVTVLVRMTQEVPDQVLVPLPAAQLTKSTMCR